MLPFLPFRLGCECDHLQTGLMPTCQPIQGILSISIVELFWIPESRNSVTCHFFFQLTWKGKFADYTVRFIKPTRNPVYKYTGSRSVWFYEMGDTSI